MDNHGSQRMSSLSSNYFTSLSEKITALEGKRNPVIRLDIGSPDLPPPLEVVEQLQSAASRPANHGYQSHRGTVALRQAWANHYLKFHGVKLDPDSQILPLIGSKEGIFHLSLSLINPGDQVLIPDPGYQTYTMGTRFAGGMPRFVSCLSGNDFLQNLKNLPDHDLKRTKLMWVNFPHNPTGATITLDQAQWLVNFAREHNILLCHDAAYTQVTYEDYKAPSLLEVEGAEKSVVEFNSLSKSHNMAGWRLGVIVGCQKVIERLLLLKTHADSGQFLPVTEAGAVALNGDIFWLEIRNIIYRTRRDLAVEALRSMNIQIDMPQGGLYIWFPIPVGMSSEEFSTIMLERYQVALAPGKLFGSRGEGYVRLSLTAPEHLLREGLDRLSRGISELCQADAG